MNTVIDNLAFNWICRQNSSSSQMKAYELNRNQRIKNVGLAIFYSLFFLFSSHYKTTAKALAELTARTYTGKYYSEFLLFEGS